MASRSEPVVRDAEHDDVAAICQFGEAHIRPHYAPLIGPEAADEQVRRWWNEMHVGAAVAEGLVVVAEAVWSSTALVTAAVRPRTAACDPPQVDMSARRTPGGRHPSVGWGPTTPAAPLRTVEMYSAPLL